jgi:hypothetical protein
LCYFIDNISSTCIFDSFHLSVVPNLGTDHLTWRGGEGGIMVFVSFRIFFRTTRELEYIFFLSRKAGNFFPESNIRLYDKNSESYYFFFPPPKSEYFFKQHWEVVRIYFSSIFLASENWEKISYLFPCSPSIVKHNHRDRWGFALKCHVINIFRGNSNLKGIKILWCWLLTKIKKTLSFVACVRTPDLKNLKPRLP